MAESYSLVVILERESALVSDSVSVRMMLCISVRSSSAGYGDDVYRR